jgi:hypothetical protein
MYKQCLRCSYVRKRIETAPETECPNCGTVYAKFEANGRKGAIPVPVAEIGESNIPLPNGAGKKLLKWQKYLIYAVLIGVAFAFFAHNHNIVGWLVIGVVLVFRSIANHSRDIEASGHEFRKLPLAQREAIIKEAGNPEWRMQKLMNLPDFAVSDYLFDSGIALDTSRSALYLFNPADMKGRIVKHSDIVSGEVIEDGITVTKTESSGIGRAVVGGVLFGGAGAIVGAVTAGRESVSSKKVTRISLRLMLQDPTRPVFESIFSKQDDAIHWLGVVESLIKKADIERQRNVNQGPKSTPEQPKLLVADEMLKLYELHKSGVLTAEEYQAQKNRLLTAG